MRFRDSYHKYSQLSLDGFGALSSLGHPWPKFWHILAFTVFRLETRFISFHFLFTERIFGHQQKSHTRKNKKNNKQTPDQPKHRFGIPQRRVRSQAEDGSHVMSDDALRTGQTCSLAGEPKLAEKYLEIIINQSYIK